MIKKISIKTNKKSEYIDITNKIKEHINNIKEGTLIVFIPHTTCCITLNENTDPDVILDSIAKLEELIPNDNKYLHSEGNSNAHIKSSIFGNSVTLIIENGNIILGTWQGVFLCEFDGPRTREIVLKIN